MEGRSEQLPEIKQRCGNLEPFAHLAPPYGLVVEVSSLFLLDLQQLLLYFEPHNIHWLDEPPTTGQAISQNTHTNTIFLLMQWNYAVGMGMGGMGGSKTITFVQESNRIERIHLPTDKIGNKLFDRLPISASSVSKFSIFTCKTNSSCCKVFISPVKFKFNLGQKPLFGWT